MNLELFPCSGGMAEGFRRAGIGFSFAFDKDPHACDSYERNLGHRPVQIDVRDLVRMARLGWSPGPVRLLVADPPCTPWSRAGKRLGVEDERDMLGDTTELIGLLRPRAYLIGNVPGLDDSTQWHHLQEALGPLRALGYCVADYVSLDAADYGVPQHRIRPFWFGHLDGPCIRWPAPTHGKPGNLHLPGCELRPWVTCREALRHLPIEALGRPVRMRIREAGEDGRKNGGDRTRCSAPDKPATTVVAKADRKGGSILIPDDGHPFAELDGQSPTIRGGGEGHSAPQVVLNLRHPPAAPAAPAATIGAKDRGQSTVLEARDPREWPWDRPSTTILRDPRIPPPGHHDSGSFLSAKEARGSRKVDPNRPPASLDEPHRTISTARDQAVAAWPWDRPSTTVCAGIDKIAPAGEHAGQFGPNAVVLSERAAAILQGFPENWHFAGATKKARWSQLGQAMPPPLAHAVAKSVRAQMEAAEGWRVVLQAVAVPEAEANPPPAKASGAALTSSEEA